MGRPPKGEQETPSIRRSFGTTATGAIHQLRKRGRHDLIDRVGAGEISPHRAAVLAGIRKPTATVPVDSADAAIKALLRRFSPAQLSDALAKHTGRQGT